MARRPIARFDIHIHSEHSPDSEIPVRRILARAKKLGLTGVAITDHNSLRGSREALQIRPAGLVVVPGMEVSTSGGHVLAIGVNRGIKRGMTPSATRAAIEAIGGVAIAAHPFRYRTGIGRDEVIRGRFSLLEVLNARTLGYRNRRAKDLAMELQSGRTGGSDSHTLEELAHAHTVVPGPVETAEEFLEHLRKRRCRPAGSDRATRTVGRRATENVVRWVRRGLHDI